MAVPTRCSRGVAGLAPSTTVSPAPVPAAAPKKSSFRRSAARAENTPKHVVTSIKRTIEEVSEANDSPTKRPRPSPSNNANTPHQQLMRELAAHTPGPRSTFLLLLSSFDSLLPISSVPVPVASAIAPNQNEFIGAFFAFLGAAGPFDE